MPYSVLSAYALSTPKPAYPQLRVSRMETSVAVRATISKEGKVTSTHALTGTLEVQAAAVDAVKNWRFKPYLVDGEPVDVVTTVNFVFKAQ